MRIIAIDPGYDRCGVAVMDGPTVLYSTCIETNKNDNHHDRLATVYRSLEMLINEWQPQALALETLFFSVNKKTAMKVAEARGVAVLIAGIKQLHLIELSPAEVKQAMTGVGNATKEQVQKMVSLTLKIDLSQKIDDEVDAIAVGIAAGQRVKMELLKKGLAK